MPPPPPLPPSLPPTPCCPAVGLLQHIPGLGVRAMRYSLLVEDGKVVKVNVEEAGAKSYKISGPQTILNELGELKGQSA